jgi:DNA-directed RNA polymerase subunit RPC12/RpoP
MMGMLFLKCKTCGEKFASGISADEKSFKTLTLRNNTHQCPKCGQRHSYDTKDYFF